MIDLIDFKPIIMMPSMNRVSIIESIDQQTDADDNQPQIAWFPAFVHRKQEKPRKVPNA